MRSSQTSWKRILASCLVGIVVGFVLITLPSILHRDHVHSVFDLVRSSVKNMSSVDLVLLFAGGFFWGLALKWPYSFFAAGCQVAGLPLIAVLEMISDPTSHNLWPIEFLIYGALALVCLIGMTVGLLARRFLSARA
jgi:hypothetical protein